MFESLVLLSKPFADRKKKRSAEIIEYIKNPKKVAFFVI
jgi:hypothetical protein